MRTMRLTCRDGAYRCSEPGDQSGEWVRAEVAAELLTALQEMYRAYAEAHLLRSEVGYGDEELDMAQGRARRLAEAAMFNHAGDGQHTPAAADKYLDDYGRDVPY